MCDREVEEKERELTRKKHDLDRREKELERKEEHVHITNATNRKNERRKGDSSELVGLSWRIEEVEDEDCEDDSGNEVLYILIVRPTGN